MKEKIKKIKFIGKFLLKLKAKYVFKYDRKLFVNNFINGTKNNNTINYDLLLEIHKLEKGMTASKIRPFGRDKINKIIILLNEYEKSNYDKSFAYNLAISILKKYIEVYENNSWNDKEEYKMVKDFLGNIGSFENIKCGTKNLLFEEIKNDLNIDYMKFLESRHSIRNYSKKELLKEDVEKAIKMATLSPSACNRQMCKIYQIVDDQKKKVLEKYVRGLSLFELENANYFVISFDINAFYFIGERNQGWFNAGLFCMNFVNALHSMKIGSCIAQFANSPKEEEYVKKCLEIEKSERIAAVVVCGYYDKKSIIPISSRKDINEIFSLK